MNIAVPQNCAPRATDSDCDGCSRQENCLLALSAPIEPGTCAAEVRRYSVPAGTSLFHHNMLFSAVYLVSKGAVKTQRVTPEGCQLVTGFYFNDDVVGLEALGDTQYPCEAIALTSTTICKINFGNLLSLCCTRPEVQFWLLSKIGLYARIKDVNLSWSKGMNSRNRVLRLFLELNERLDTFDAEQKGSTALPMKKQDIAHYLHITPETLSRNLAELCKKDLLRIENDRFVLPDLVRARQLTQF